jgi:uncharacterized membrane protein
MVDHGAQLAKYEAWILELEQRQRTLAGTRTGYLRFFTGALAASALGFFWNPWVGVGTLLTGIIFCAFGFYVVLRREGDYVRELAEARETTRSLRASAAG